MDRFGYSVSGAAGEPPVKGLLLVGVVVVGLAGCAATPSESPETTRTVSLIKDCEDCPQLVIVPPGRFQMGSLVDKPERPEGPLREINIDYFFALGRYEVTVAQYRQFMESTGHRPSGNCRVWIDGTLPAGASHPRPEPETDGPWRGFVNDPASDWRNPQWRRDVNDDDPIVCVNWRDALAYVDWLAEITGQPYRLPTEAEWEYVARAGTSGSFPWGDNAALGCEHANIYDQSAASAFNFPWDGEACDDGFAAVAPVGQFRPNRFGVFDIVGNVWEWTQDCYQAYYPEEPVDGSAVEVKGDCETRTVRGGSWITATVRQRPTFRGRDPEEAKYSYFGFRVARDFTD